jgi:hypothetical protein
MPRFIYDTRDVTFCALWLLAASPGLDLIGSWRPSAFQLLPQLLGGRTPELALGQSTSLDSRQGSA